ncbi:hypothetical protein [uncultured Stenotrophomonas sp.]|uniref:hypothetical protein n=1 Tax=uncultured Stenotrophomonas sp. TaxID=165438 RepID=UPI0025D1C942|nr:hypothetical protein [uncultured Stenotrophomonas sp.]
MKKGHWLPLLPVVALAGCSKAEEDGAKAAFQNCVSAIQAASTIPAATNVPPAKDFGSGEEHYFAWPEGSGLSVAQRNRTRDSDSGSCITDGAGVVTALTINGAEVPLK